MKWKIKTIEVSLEVQKMKAVEVSFEVWQTEALIGSCNVKN